MLSLCRFFSFSRCSCSMFRLRKLPYTISSIEMRQVETRDESMIVPYAHWYSLPSPPPPRYGNVYRSVRVPCKLTYAKQHTGRKQFHRVQHLSAKKVYDDHVLDERNAESVCNELPCLCLAFSVSLSLVFFTIHSQNKSCQYESTRNGTVVKRSSMLYTVFRFSIPILSYRPKMNQHMQMQAVLVRYTLTHTHTHTLFQ